MSNCIHKYHFFHFQDLDLLSQEITIALIIHLFN